MYVHVHVGTCVYACVGVHLYVHSKIYQWKSEDNLKELIFSFPLVGPKNIILVIMIDKVFISSTSLLAKFSQF